MDDLRRKPYDITMNERFARDEGTLLRKKERQARTAVISATCAPVLDTARPAPEMSTE